MVMAIADTGADVAVNGTSLIGTVRTTYADLVIAFGAPTYNIDDRNEKVNTEWNIELYDTQADEYIVASIYNWKTGYTPVASYDWHIGGYNDRAVAAVIEALNDALDD